MAIFGPFLVIGLLASRALYMFFFYQKLHKERKVMARQNNERKKSLVVLNYCGIYAYQQLKRKRESLIRKSIFYRIFSHFEYVITCDDVSSQTRDVEHVFGLHT